MGSVYVPGRKFGESAQRLFARVLPALALMLIAAMPLQSQAAKAKRILWEAVREDSTIEEVKAKYPSSFQWSQASDPFEAPSDGKSPTTFVLKPAEQDVKQALNRFQVGADGSIFSIPTFQFIRRGDAAPALMKVDLTVFSARRPAAELRGIVQADLSKAFGPVQATKTGNMKGYGRLNFIFFEEAATGRIVCLTLPEDEKLPLSITYTFPAAAREKWLTDKRC